MFWLVLENFKVDYKFGRKLVPMRYIPLPPRIIQEGGKSRQSFSSGHSVRSSRKVNSVRSYSGGHLGRGCSKTSFRRDASRESFKGNIQ